MQAAVIYKPGDIRLEEVPKPTAKKGEALLRITAVGVCGSDIPRLLTKGAHRMPIICGHEFSGEIVEVGEEVDGFDIGELVGVAPMLPCRVCDQCMTGNFSRCRNYDYFGSRRYGAYAEFVAAPMGNLLKTPKGTDPRAIDMTDPASIALLHDLPRMFETIRGRNEHFSKVMFGPDSWRGCLVSISARAACASGFSTSRSARSRPSEAFYETHHPRPGGRSSRRSIGGRRSARRPGCDRRPRRARDRRRLRRDDRFDRCRL